MPGGGTGMPGGGGGKNIYVVEDESDERETRRLPQNYCTVRLVYTHFKAAPQLCEQSRLTRDIALRVAERQGDVGT